jgi:hypothetical protein
MIDLKTEDYGKFIMLNLPWMNDKMGIGLLD